LESLEQQRQDPELWANVESANSIIADLDIHRSAAQRIETLHDRLTDIGEPLTNTCSRHTIKLTDARLQDLTAVTNATYRELVSIGFNDPQDALVQINPMSTAYALHRDTLFSIYKNWSDAQRYTMQILHEPLNNSEPIMFSLKGEYCYGYLKRENGTHRFRHEGLASGAIRVRVTPWLDEHCQPEFESRIALKKTGQLGNRIRSSTVVNKPCRLVLQNEHTLEYNRELAIQYAQSWHQRVPDIDENIRRYDENPFMIKDHLTQQTFNRRNCLKPESFHELLCQRVDTQVLHN